MQSVYLTLRLLTHPATVTTQAQSTYHHQLAETQGQTLPASLRQISNESQQQLRKERGITGSVGAKSCVCTVHKINIFLRNVSSTENEREIAEKHSYDLISTAALVIGERERK